MNLKNCPDEYYENCQNQIRACYRCAAGSGSKTLCYEPIDDSLTPHPHEQVLKQQKWRGKEAHRQGKQTEKKSRQRLADQLVKETIASGAVNGDADFILSELSQIEHKSRKSLSITQKEYEKGLKQGVGIWQITHPETNRRVYILTEDLFVQITATYYKNNADTERPTES